VDKSLVLEIGMAAFPILRMPSLADKDTSPQMERDSLKFRNAQTRFSAVQGLLFGSSSSVMLRLVGHGIVSETNSAARGSRRRRLLSSAKEGVRGGDATP
jgi:hypothetical protein